MFSKLNLGVNMKKKKKHRQAVRQANSPAGKQPSQVVCRVGESTLKTCTHPTITYAHPHQLTKKHMHKKGRKKVKTFRCFTDTHTSHTPALSMLDVIEEIPCCIKKICRMKPVRPMAL